MENIEPVISSTTTTNEDVITDASNLNSESNSRVSDNILLTSTNVLAFESITKLPSGITTPQTEENSIFISESTASDSKTNVLTTQPIKKDDFEVTTIRFTYIPTILESITETTESTVTTTTDVWHPVTAEITRGIIEDAPVTTYRPQYVTTTDMIEETSTVIPETTVSQKSSTTTETEINTTITTLETETPISVKESISPTTTEEVPYSETSTVIVEVVTEINTERETRKPVTTAFSKITEMTESTSSQSLNTIDSVSEENSGSNEVITHKESTTASNQESEDEMTIIPMSKVETEDPFDQDSKEKPEEDPEDNEVPEKSEIPEPQTESEKYSTTSGHNVVTSSSEATHESSEDSSTTEDSSTRLVNELEDVSAYGDMTTEASSRVLDETGSGAAVAIAVSTIGVIALILLVGLLVSLNFITITIFRIKFKAFLPFKFEETALMCRDL